MAKVPRDTQERIEKRRTQNRDAQRRYRAKLKKRETREETQRSSHAQEESVATSPTLDMSILERPSARFRIEIVHRKLEKTLEQYNTIVAENVGDPSVTQFMAEKWPSLQTMFQTGFGYVAGDFNAIHALPRDHGVVQQLASCPSRGSPGLYNLPTPDSSIIQQLSSLTERVIGIRGPHSMAR